MRLFHDLKVYAPEDGTGAVSASESEAAAIEPVTVEADLSTETPATEPSLLASTEGKQPIEGETPAPVEAAVHEATKEGAANAATAQVEERPAQVELEPVTYTDFTLPDGIQLSDDTALKEFKEVVGNHRLSQDDAQKLVDLHLQDIQRVQADAVKRQNDHWRALNDGWKSELRNDPELGGNRVTTTLSIAKAVIEEFGGSKEQQAELMAHIENNGMGNYPGFIRMLHNMGKALNVFEDNIVPAHSSVNASSTKSRAERWYGNNGKAG
jgi:hypothetical protein